MWRVCFEGKKTFVMKMKMKIMMMMRVFCFPFAMSFSLRNGFCLANTFNAFDAKLYLSLSLSLFRYLSLFLSLFLSLSCSLSLSPFLSLYIYFFFFFLYGWKQCLFKNSQSDDCRKIHIYFVFVRIEIILTTKKFLSIEVKILENSGKWGLEFSISSIPLKIIIRNKLNNKKQNLDFCEIIPLNFAR